MKKPLLLIGAIALSMSMYGQELERCATTNYMEYRESIQPGYIQSTVDAFNVAKASQEGVVLKSNEIYTIPVVVHIVYNTEEQNLDDSVIHDQIRVLNEDFMRENADTTNMRDDFVDVAGRGNIRFKLADFDPDGNPTTGITRTETDKSSFFGMDIAESVKKTATGGIDPWDQNRYMNIWVCNMELPFLGPAVLGYATPPVGLPNWPDEQDEADMSDGVVVQFQVFGSNNPNTLTPGYVAMGRTTTHEVGHYLGLRHIWGDSEDCLEDDGIDDTPDATENHQSSGCITKNTCEDDINGVDLPDMYENYMDYSEETCQNSFTKGQFALMRGVLENQRQGLIAEDNDALSINEMKGTQFAMYPNPSNSIITITSKEALDGTVRILDMNGKVVKEVELNGFDTVINIETLQSGIYQVMVDGAVSVKKLVKL